MHAPAFFDEVRSLSGKATPDETRQFRENWQARVRTLLLVHGDDPEVFPVRPTRQ